MTMELVEGRSLDALIPPPGMALGEFFQIAVPIADALTAAHQRHITPPTWNDPDAIGLAWAEVT